MSRRFLSERSSTRAVSLEAVSARAAARSSGVVALCQPTRRVTPCGEPSTPVGPSRAGSREVIRVGREARGRGPERGGAQAARRRPVPVGSGRKDRRLILPPVRRGSSEIAAGPEGSGLEAAGAAPRPTRCRLCVSSLVVLGEGDEQPPWAVDPRNGQASLGCAGGNLSPRAA